VPLAVLMEVQSVEAKVDVDGRWRTKFWCAIATFQNHSTPLQHQQQWNIMERDEGGGRRKRYNDSLTGIDIKQLILHELVCTRKRLEIEFLI
jgi:hypothetical protein